MSEIHNVKCDFCGKIWVDDHLAKEKYNSGFIQIRDGSVMIPFKTVKKRHKDGVSDSHCSNIDGDYCDYKCLTNKIIKSGNNILSKLPMKQYKFLYICLQLPQKMILSLKLQ